jgi:hypothetical protein
VVTWIVCVCGGGLSYALVILLAINGRVFSLSLAF